MFSQGHSDGDALPAAAASIGMPTALQALYSDCTVAAVLRLVMLLRLARVASHEQASSNDQQAAQLEYVACFFCQKTPQDGLIEQRSYGSSE